LSVSLSFSHSLHLSKALGIHLLLHLSFLSFSLLFSPFILFFFHSLFLIFYLKYFLCEHLSSLAYFFSKIASWAFTITQRGLVKYLNVTNCLGY
jgi:hypothetical protein